MDQLLIQLDRIEHKLDMLIQALAEAEADDEDPRYTLDGELIEDGEREENQSLG